jgi:hypothetical protein
VALVAFFPTQPEGALGALSYTPEERRALALTSRAGPPQSALAGERSRAEVAARAHAYLLACSPEPEKRAAGECAAEGCGQAEAAEEGGESGESEEGPSGAAGEDVAESEPPAQPVAAAAAADGAVKAAAPAGVDLREDWHLLVLAFALAFALAMLLMRRLGAGRGDDGEL